MSSQPLAAVLTGDLVASRKAAATETDRAMDALARAARTFGAENDLDLRFTRFRGDGWQVLVDTTALALDAALALLAATLVEDMETRISIGIGPVDSRGSADLSDASGRAFFVSGDHLEAIDRHRRLLIAGHGIGPWQVAALDLVDRIASGWTAAQAEAAAHVLRPDPLTQDEIAGRLGITRQAVQSRLAAAGTAYFTNVLKAFRTHDYSGSAEAP